MMSDTHYGPLNVVVHPDERRAVMTLKRWRDPLPGRVLRGLRRWAVSVIEADCPDYEIDDQTGLQDGED